MPPEVEQDQAGASEREMVAAAMGVLGLLAEDAPEAQLKTQIHHVANHYAPQELSAFYKMLAEYAEPEALARIVTLAPQWQYFSSRRATVYRREVLMPGAILYRSAVKGAERGALVAFAAGPMHNLFMANTRFLDLLGHLPVDVLIVSNRQGKFGRWVMGDTGSKYLAMQRLKTRLAAKGVQPRCYVGASAGGEAALVAAALDPGTLGITLSGRFYRPGQWVPLSQAPPAFLPLCLCGSVRPAIHALYNADEPVDHETHQMLKAMAPQARIYPIPKDATHNPLVTLAARGKLREVFGQIGVAAFGREPDFSTVCGS